MFVSWAERFVKTLKTRVPIQFSELADGYRLSYRLSYITNYKLAFLHSEHRIFFWRFWWVVDHSLWNIRVLGLTFCGPLGHIIIAVGLMIRYVSKNEDAPHFYFPLALRPAKCMYLGMEVGWKWGGYYVHSSCYNRITGRQRREGYANTKVL